MKVVQVAQVAKPDGVFVEIFNRERGLTYARGLGIRGVASPNAAAVETELGVTFTDPATDSMFWADTPLAELVSGMIPVRVIGFESTTLSQPIGESVGSLQVPGEPRQTPRAVTFECMIAGVTCCAVAQYKRRVDQWLADGLSCAGLTMKLLLTVPSTAEPCVGAPVAVDAEWFILKNVAVTQGLRTTNAVPDNSCKCGSTCLDVVRFTFTAGDPHLYQIETPFITDEGFAAPDISDNTAEHNTQFDTEVLPVTLPKRALPLKLFLDNTACPIGWNISDYPVIGTDAYLTVIEKEIPPPFVPYRASLRVYEDATTEWAKINPARWPSDGSIPCDDIVAADIEFPNESYDPSCESCSPGLQAAMCAADQGLIIDEFGIIDWDASGIDPAFEYIYTPGGGAPAAIVPLLNYWKCLGITAKSTTSGRNGEGLDERGLWDLQGYFDDATEDGGVWSPDGSSFSPFTIDAVGLIVDNPSGGGVLIKVGEEVTPGTVTPANTNYQVKVDTFLGYDGLNPLVVPAQSCGPGEAEHIGTMAYHVMVGAKLDLSAFYGVDISGDVNEISVPDLTVTPLFTPGGGGGEMAYNPDLDEVWHIDLNPAASATLDLYENNVLVNTVTALDWGFDAAPFWDVAGGRMLVVLGGMNNSPQSRPDVRTDMVIAEWTTGGVFTEIHSWPIPLHPTPSILVRPIPYLAIATPNGGCFFALEKDADEPTTSGNNTLGYWSPLTGFIFGIGPKLLDATGAFTGDTNLYFGATHAITPSGDFVWPYEDNPIETFWQINENEIATPPEDTVPVEPTVCTATPLTPADTGRGIPGTGFLKGLATLQDENSPFDIDVFLLNHVQVPIATCGNNDLTHCQPTRVVNLNVAPPTGEAFPIELQTDGTWLHPTWNFLRDGIPPDHASVKVEKPADCERVCYDVQDAPIDVTVGATEITWAPDTWTFDPEKGFPDEYTVVVNGQAPGTYADTRTARVVKTAPPEDTLDDILFPQAAPYSLISPQIVPDWVLLYTPTSIAETIDRFPTPATSGRAMVPRIVVQSGANPLPFFRVRLLAGEDATVYTVGDVTDEAADAGFIVVGLPADSSLEFDVSRQRATLYVTRNPGDDPIAQDASPLVRGLFNESIRWENFVFTDDRDIVVVTGVDATSVGEATWSMWAQPREVG